FRSSYEHTDPALVGNETRVVVSELSGRRNVHMRAEALGLDLPGRERQVLQRITDLEGTGCQGQAADGPSAILARRSPAAYEPPFELLDYTASVSREADDHPHAQARVRVRIGSEVMETEAEAEGPVEALDRAIRSALLPHYPELHEVHLVDYKVRVIDTHLGTAAKPRVLMESARGEDRWSTVGCSENVIEASWQALWDSLELPLARSRNGR